MCPIILLHDLAPLALGTTNRGWVRLVWLTRHTPFARIAAFRKGWVPAQLAHEGLATVYSDTLSAHITTLF